MSFCFPDEKQQQQQIDCFGLVKKEFLMLFLSRENLCCCCLYEKIILKNRQGDVCVLITIARKNCLFFHQNVVDFVRNTQTTKSDFFS